MVVNDLNDIRKKDLFEQNSQKLKPI